MLTACDDEEDPVEGQTTGTDTTDTQAVVAAPTELVGHLVTGGVHLTWKDNSTNELHFMLFRHVKGESESADPLAFPKADETAYHDTSVAAATTYIYKITAMNAEGVQSMPSNEFEIAIP